MENGNSYVVRERGGRRREGAREEGGAGLRPRPPPGADPERSRVQLLWVSSAGIGSPGLGSPEDASAWSSLREPSCLQPLPVQALLRQRRLRCVCFLQQLPRAGRTWRRERARRQDRKEEEERAAPSRSPDGGVEDEGCTQISTSTGSPSRARGDSLLLGPRSWSNRASDES